jgi:septum formation inhibitor-activating ATPase MinD
MHGGNVMDKTMLSAREITNAIQLELYGVVPENNDINLYSVISELKLNSSARFSYNLIAEYIDGGPRKIFDYTAAYKGAFSRFLRKLKQ